MKKINSVVTIVMAAWFLQACSNTKTDSKANADSVNAVKDTTAIKDTSSKMSTTVEKEDAQFAVEAASGGMTEVELGKLAQQKGINARVKKFGAMMVMDHTKANNELMALAKTKNITLPAAPGIEGQQTIDMLTKKSGSDFDKAYVSDMIDDHKKDIKAFEDASKNCKDPDVKAFVIKTLPVLKTHLDAINAVHDSMK